MNIPKELQTLQLPPNSYIIVGSGILNALGIRESADIDLIVTQETYDRFEREGWEHDTWPSQPVLKRGIFDVGRQWDGKSVPELLKGAQYVEGIPYFSLDDVFAWKKSLGREKDVRDVELIKRFKALSGMS